MCIRDRLYTSYWPNGKIKEQGSYTQIEGKSGVTAINQYGKSRTTFIKVNNLPVRNGNWNYYDEFGKLCLLYTSPSPRDRTRSRMPSSACKKKQTKKEKKKKKKQKT